jgi:nucleoid-associated protein YgaU
MEGIHVMKHAIGTAVLVVLSAAFAGGCTQEKKTQSSVLEVGPASTIEPGVQPAPVSPQKVETPRSAKPKPVSAQPLETTTPGAAAPSAGQTYTVKKGDTLFGIAKTHYGDGNKWQKIASANPGVTPSTLKIGQVVMLPNN